MARAKQLDSGLAKPTKHKRIEELAEELDEVRSERMRLTTKEVEAQEKLIAEMHTHKLTIYKYDGKTVSIDAKERAKIKHEKDDGE